MFSFLDKLLKEKMVVVMEVVVVVVEFSENFFYFIGSGCDSCVF